jgi:hypothetical protein
MRRSDTWNKGGSKESLQVIIEDSELIDISGAVDIYMTEGSCECGNEPSGSTKRGEFLE